MERQKMMYKVRVVEHVYKVKTEEVDGEVVETSRKLWDTKIYNVIVAADSKKLARFAAEKKVDAPKQGYVSKIKAGKVWHTDEPEGVSEPEEKEVVRDVNWRETIKEMV